VSGATDGRGEILARIGAALGRPPARSPGDPVAVVASVPRTYRGAGAEAGAALDLIARFAERVAEYRAGVTVVAPGEVAGEIARLAGGDGREVVAAPGLDAAWLADLPGAVRDDPDSPAPALDRFAVAVAASAVAIAETGTIVLDHRPDQGRRALSLVPDHLVCVVDGRRIVADVPDAVAALDPTRPLTWISGPSATSDIELDRVEGVHGPRRLDVVVVVDPPAGRPAAGA